MIDRREASLLFGEGSGARLPIDSTPVRRPFGTV